MTDLLLRLETMSYPVLQAQSMTPVRSTSDPNTGRNADPAPLMQVRRGSP
jgi:hypothetical protein